MRLSGWGALAPDPAVLAPRVRSVLDPILAALGAESDPHVLPVWGDDAIRRYVLYVLSPTGLIVAAVRFDLPDEPPRIVARLVRWSKLQLGELAMETSAGHRVVSVTIDGQVFRAADETADRIAAFVRAIHSLEEGRPLPELGEGSPSAVARPILAAAPGADAVPEGSPGTGAAGGAAPTVPPLLSAGSTSEGDPR